MTGSHKVLCLSQFQLGAPPDNPREIFFERANPGHPGIFLFNSPAPEQKMMVGFPGVRQNFPKLEELLIKLAKIL